LRNKLILSSIKHFICCWRWSRLYRMWSWNMEDG